MAKIIIKLSSGASIMPGSINHNLLNNLNGESPYIHLGQEEYDYLSNLIDDDIILEVDNIQEEISNLSNIYVPYNDSNQNVNLGLNAITGASDTTPEDNYDFYLSSGGDSSNGYLRLNRFSGVSHYTTYLTDRISFVEDPGIDISTNLFLFPKLINSPSYFTFSVNNIEADNTGNINIDIPGSQDFDSVLENGADTDNNANFKIGKGITYTSENPTYFGYMHWQDDGGGGQGYLSIESNFDTYISASNGIRLLADDAIFLSTASGSGGTILTSLSSGVVISGNTKGITLAGDTLGITFSTGAGEYTINNKSFKYSSDFSGTYTDRSLVDRGYVSTNFASLTGAIFTGDVQGNVIPVNANSFITKGYFDNFTQNLSWKFSVRASTTSAGFTNANIAGDNITITSNINEVLVLDGITLVTDDRVLVKNIGSPGTYANGIYRVFQQGSASTPWVLVRTEDANTGSKLLGATVYVRQGNTEANRVYAVNVNSASIVLGTTPITFALISGAGTYSNGTGLLLSGNVFSIDNTYITTATQTALNTKQATLVSGTNIKTIGGQSILGSGDITEVQNSLTSSTILAPSVTAVNTGLALKANLTANTFTGTQTYATNIVSDNAGSRSVGTTSLYFNAMYATNFLSPVSPMIIGTISANNTAFRYNNTTVMILSSAALSFAADNTMSFGIPANRASNVYSYLGNFAGNITTIDATSALHAVTLQQLQSLTFKGSGQSTQSGTGALTSFTITHGLSGITSTNKVFITPRSLAAANIQYLTLSSTTITIFYSVAPATGTNNLIWDWQII